LLLEGNKILMDFSKESIMKEMVLQANKFKSSDNDVDMEMEEPFSASSDPLSS
jgi:hypothetical protein